VRLQDVPFLRSQRPRDLEQRDRVRTLVEFKNTVLAGRDPSRASLMFLASALDAYFEKGGSLTKQYLQIDAKAGSHFTPQVIAREIANDPGSSGRNDKNEDSVDD